MTEEEFLEKLNASSSDEERNKIVTQRLLESLPNELSQMAYIAAIPRWFDVDILTALNPEKTEQINQLYTDLKQLPFVEPFQGQWHNIHEITRRFMLDFLRKEHLDDYKRWSGRMADYLNQKIRSSSEIIKSQIEKLNQNETDGAIRQEKLDTWLSQSNKLLYWVSPTIQIEQIYHLVIANPSDGSNAVRDFGLLLPDQFNGYQAIPYLSSLTQAVAELVQLGQAPEQVKNWGDYWEGVLATSRYNFASARNSFTALLANTGQDNQLRAYAAKSLGDIHARFSEFKEARARYEEAQTIFIDIDDKRGDAYCLKALGDIHARFSEFKEAERCYKHALKIFQKIGEELGKADSLLALGDIYNQIPNQISKFQLTPAPQEKAMVIYQGKGIKSGEAHCIKAIGDVHYISSRFKEAREHYEEALKIYQEIDQSLGKANCIRALGKVHYTLSEFKDAREHYETALKIYKTIDEKPAEANCARSLGDVYYALSKLKDAGNCYRSALKIYENLGNKLGMAKCNQALGNIYIKSGEVQQGFECFERALIICREIGPSFAALALDTIANAHYELKEYGKAIDTYAQAIELFSNDAYLWRNRAKVYLKLRETENAKQDIDKAAELQPKNAYLFLRYGELANLLGNYKEAIDHFLLALELFPRMNIAYFGIGLAHLKAGNHFQDAQIAYNEGLAVTYSRHELADVIDELQKIKLEQPNIVGIDDILNLLDNWKSTNL